MTTSLLGRGPRAALANRLSEDADVSVLLIEAGGTDSDMAIHIPLAYIFWQKTRVDWRYTTKLQDHACQKHLESQSCWPSSKVLGETSFVNAMIYTRGSSHDHSRWEELYEAEGGVELG